MASEIQPKSLSVAVALAELGSATRAARALSMSQPGVSYHLRLLEGALGATLFRRTAAGLVTTSEGELLVERARTVLTELARLERDVRAAASGQGRTIRLSSACFTNYHWLPAVLREFRTRYGDVCVELDVDPTRRPFAALERGSLDIALTTVPPQAGPFTLHELFDDEIVAVLSPDHALAEKDYLEPGDFADQSVVVFDRSQSDLFNLALAPAGVTPRQVTDMPVTEALLELVRAGVGISAMASWVAQPDLDHGRLRSVRIGRTGLHRTWWAVLSAGRETNHAAARFLEVLRSACAASPPRSGSPNVVRTGDPA